MNDSFRYAPLIAFVLVLAKYISGLPGIGGLNILVEFGVLTIGMWMALGDIKKRNSAYFPFKVVWLSGFNIMVLTSILVGLIVALAAPLIYDSPLTINERFFAAFLAFVQAEFIGLIIVTILSFALKKK